MPYLKLENVIIHIIIIIIIICPTMLYYHTFEIQFEIIFEDKSI